MTISNKDVLFAASLEVLNKTIQDLKNNEEIRQLLGDNVLGKTALVVTDKSYGFVALENAGLNAKQEEEFIKALVPILEKNMK